MTVYLTDIGAFAAVNEVYATFFEADPPARVTIGAAALPKGAQVEIDAIVALPVRLILVDVRGLWCPTVARRQ